MPTARRHLAFTLIELMVVVSVIAVLIGLVVPGLSKARETARSATCLSAIRQIGLANLNYALDHRDRLVPYAANGSATTQNQAWCFGYFTPADSLEDAFRNGLLSSYLQDAHQIAGCPSWSTPNEVVAEAQASVTSFAFPAFVHYGYNGFELSYPAADHSTTGNWVGLRSENLKSPTETVMFADSGTSDPDGIAGDAVDAVYPSDYVVSPTYTPNKPTIHARHNDGHNASVVWADGHATSQRPVFYSDQDDEDIAKRLGHLDPDDGDGRTDEYWTKN